MDCIVLHDGSSFEDEVRRYIPVPYPVLSRDKEIVRMLAKCHFECKVVLV